MLELENISFSADSDGGEKEIIKNISLKIDESFVVIFSCRCTLKQEKGSIKNKE